MPIPVSEFRKMLNVGRVYWSYWNYGPRGRRWVRREVVQNSNYKMAATVGDGAASHMGWAGLVVEQDANDPALYRLFHKDWEKWGNVREPFVSYYLGENAPGIDPL